MDSHSFKPQFLFHSNINTFAFLYTAIPLPFNMAIKAKLGETLKNKNFVSQTNELLCKLIAYNITVLIHEIYDLGINPTLLIKG